MQFVFFGMDDRVLFVRDDAESGTWQEEEFSITAMFPFRADKRIQRGQRIGFDDGTGGFQVFEIRKVRDYEPDHYQEITAEHIAVSELTDEYIDEIKFTNIEPNAALEEVLSGTLWQVGNVSVGDLNEQRRLRAAINLLALNGNVDLTKRPIVYPEKMKAAGYTDFDGDYATLYSMTYTWEDDEETVLATVLVTPIRKDGTVLGPDGIEEYVTKLFEDAETYSVDNLKDADSQGLLMHVLPGEQIDEMDVVAEQAHSLSDDWESCISGEASSSDIGRGNVWSAIGSIRKDWNVYITPRITVDSSGITGRYLDIEQYGGVFRGLRLSIDKNIDNVGVTVDDTNVITAMKAYGRSTSEKAGEEPIPLTFTDVVWQETEDHPAKPAGQDYLVNPAAFALYGRNGRHRWGFFQNSGVDDPEILLQLAWKTMKQDAAPNVTVDCVLQDLYRLGYNDVPVRLHDRAIVELRPTGEMLELEIVALTVDLLHPQETRPTIGKYIPNIIYINREINDRTHTSGGGRGETEEEYVRGEFEAAIDYNKYQISLRATQYDLDDLSGRTAVAQAQLQIDRNNILGLVTGTGVTLDENGYIVTDAQGNPVFTPGNPISLFSRFQQTATGVQSLVSQTGIVTEQFDPETAYPKGAKVIHNDVAWEFTEAHPAGPWTGTDVVRASSLQSQITQQAGVITSEVTRLEGADTQLGSLIQQEANRISLLVEGTGENAQVKASVIIAAVTDSNGKLASTITIDASQIYLNGTVLATALDAAYIRTDNITATTSNVGVLYVAGINARRSGSSGGTVIAPTVSASEVLRIGSGGGEQGSASGSLYYQGNEYVSRKLSLGVVNNYIAMGNVLSTGSGDLNLNHTHTMALTEVQSGDNAGKLQITASSAVAENDGTASAYFDITTLSALSGAVSSFSVSGNVLTLNRFDGTHETFSKATLVSGSWSSATGTYTAIATQNGVEVGRASTSPTISKGSWTNGQMTVTLVDSNQSTGVTETVAVPSGVFNSGAEVSQGVFSVSYDIGGTRQTVSGNINASLTYAAGETSGFDICHDSIDLSASSQTLSPGGSVTIYPKAKASKSASSASNITSKGITITAPSGGGNVSIDSISGQAIPEPSYNNDSNPGSIVVTASNDTSSDTAYENLYLTIGSWSSGHIAVNIRVGSSSGTLIARRWITLPTPSYKWTNPAQGYAQVEISLCGATYYTSHNVSNYV